MLRSASLLALVALVGCAKSSTPDDASTDARVRDTGVDAPIRDTGRDAPSQPPDAPDDSCPPVSVQQCCCRGDVVTDPPVCRDGRWVCAAGWEYHTGFDCGWSCGAACSASCDAGVLQCEGSGAFYEEVERRCVDGMSCVAVTRQTDCCGTRAVTGVASSARFDFERDAATCGSRFPDCDCAAGPTTADDGSTGDPDAVIVECVAGTCRTRF
ncbi:MAG: hypothetical protein H6721_12265 [Sandaracinus sp.]|nr:hypothetical protein [Myxococcales bacterium]MCB9600408.1 hypothetical protein [Sandaracinus sp.]MCB9614747.1 hypothetical protein [Sandaracinus sp.]MCB9624191.1 hypothetical protein [Sandaracinus sp.]MCB9632896.1 hypothetical protein [Sandaracinus sp.]